MIAKDACSMRQEKPRALPAANLWLAQNLLEFRPLKALRPRYSVLTAQDDTAPHKCPCAEFLQNPLCSSGVLSFRTTAQTQNALFSLYILEKSKADVQDPLRL